MYARLNPNLWLITAWVHPQFTRLTILRWFSVNPRICSTPEISENVHCRSVKLPAQEIMIHDIVLFLYSDSKFVEIILSSTHKNLTRRKWDITRSMIGYSNADRSTSLYPFRWNMPVRSDCWPSRSTLPEYASGTGYSLRHRWVIVLIRLLPVRHRCFLWSLVTIQFQRTPVHRMFLIARSWWSSTLRYAPAVLAILPAGLFLWVIE